MKIIFRRPQTVSTQHLGLGLILSTLLITVPPMAGMWFHGVMGNFTPFTPLSTWGVRGGQAMVPPSVDGGRSMQQVNVPTTGQIEKNYGSNTINNPFVYNDRTTVSGISGNSTVDSIKPQSQIRQGQPVTTAYTHASKGENTDKSKSNKGANV